MGVLQLLASENFITYNKVIAKEYGVNSAILLGAMCSYQNSFGNDEFFKEQYKISEDTCLTEYEIQQALKILKSYGIIEVHKKGLPAKNYYKVVENKLLEIFSTSGQNFRPLEIEKLDDINNNTTTKNTITNNTNKERKASNYDAIINELILDDNLKNTVYEFIKMRKLIKKPMTDFALKKLLNKLLKMSTDVGTQIKILEQSITACWQDIYPLRDYKTKQKQDDDDWLQRMEEANREIMEMDLK